MGFARRLLELAAVLGASEYTALSPSTRLDVRIPVKPNKGFSTVSIGDR
jgi:hypothetical protein